MATTLKFKLGETVRLVAGGPDMAVKVVGTTNYTCQWFAGKKLEQGTFPGESLIKVPPTPPTKS